MGEITLTEMLEARERRARRQQALLREGGSALICFTMNIAGPVKRWALTDFVFRDVLEALEDCLGADLLWKEQTEAVTGLEAVLVCGREAGALKDLAVELETARAAGRLSSVGGRRDATIAPVSLIYGTLGPACSDAKTLEALLQAGMTGVRLNLSHAGLAAAAGQIEDLRAAARQCGVTPQLLIDMQGPELRVGALPAPLPLEEGDLVRRILGTGHSVGILAEGEEVRPLLEQGSLALERAAQTRTTLAYVPAGQRAALEQEGFLAR